MFIIELLSGLLTPSIAVITAYIAYQQYKVNKEKTKVELFDRRWGVYVTVMETLKEVIETGEVTQSCLDRFNIARNTGYFLFSSEVNEHMEQLYKKMVKLHEMSRISQEERAAKASQHSDMFKEIVKQINITKQKFTPDLKVYS